MRKSLHIQALETMRERDIDHYQGNLYLLKNAVSDRLISDLSSNSGVSTFQYEGKTWYEILNAYDRYNECGEWANRRHNHNREVLE